MPIAVSAPAEGHRGYDVEILADVSGEGRPGYAVTTGLTGYGLPEMYISPYPSRGEGSAASRVDTLDRARLLVQAADAVIDDVLEPRDVLQAELDEARVVVRFTPGEEEQPRGLVAALLPDADRVRPVLWWPEPALDEDEPA